MYSFPLRKRLRNSSLYDAGSVLALPALQQSRDGERVPDYAATSSTQAPARGTRIPSTRTSSTISYSTLSSLMISSEDGLGE